MQNIENLKPNHLQIANQTLTQEEKINVELIKKIMTEKKTTLLLIKIYLIYLIMTEKKTPLPSPRNQDWKKCKVEIEKVNKFLPNIPTGNITGLNKQIYVGENLVIDKNQFSSRESKQKYKTRMER